MANEPEKCIWTEVQDPKRMSEFTKMLLGDDYDVTRGFFPTSDWVDHLKCFVSNIGHCYFTSDVYDCDRDMMIGLIKDCQRQGLNFRIRPSAYNGGCVQIVIAKNGILDRVL